MSMRLFDMKQELGAALDSADRILQVAESANRPLTSSEQGLYDVQMLKVNTLQPQIKKLESRGTLRSLFNTHGPAVLLGGDAPTAGFAQPQANISIPAEARQPEYLAALHSFFRTGGKSHSDELTVGADGTGGYYFPGSERYTRQLSPNGMSAAMYEGTLGGSNGAGGYAVSVPTDPQITPLALPDLGIFNASTVIPTANDLKIPIQASFGAAALKSESSGTIATFGGTDPALSQIALTAYMRVLYAL